MDWQVLRDLAEQGYAPRTMLDVGAHLGAFSKAFVEIFPGCAPVLIEPNPHCAETLSRLPFESYAVAAADMSGDVELYLTKEWLQSTGASLYRENTHFFRDDVLIKARVPARRLDDMFPDRRFDVVKIDVQGAELDVLKGGKNLIAKADYVLTEVSLVDYNTGGAKADDVFAAMSDIGFACGGVTQFHRLKGVATGGLLQMDFLFVNRSRKSGRALARLSGSIELASHLTAQGDTEMAALLLRQAAGLCAPDPSAIEVLIEQSLANRDIASSLDLLIRLRNIEPQSEKLLSLLQGAMAPAVNMINGHMQKMDWAAAAELAGPLAEMLPAYLPAQQAAMVAYANLSDAVKAGVFAGRVLALNKAEPQAERIAQRSQIVAAANPSEREAARQGLLPPLGRHPLMTLKDLHDATAAVLCGQLDDKDIPRIDAYRVAAEELVVEFPEGSELAIWTKHYRLAMTAMHPAQIVGRIPAMTASPPPALAIASGDDISEAEFKRRIDLIDPAAVFFVAADTKYTSLYAEHYIESVVAKCDVPYAIVLHVIGGAGRLTEIAATLRSKNVNVFLTGDRFDAAAVTTKCYDTPPKGLSAHPAAHYQSARFQWLGWLLAALNRPIFVSDIDLLLQRGVADLLEREARSDVVLNENEHSTNAGSRLTANLLLFNPTPNGQAYASALKAYLEHALAGPEVSRWIDQFGLLMARHRLRRERPDIKFSYFDTNSDINNVMYRTYEKNPFRFLSLFHGFDMDSLKTAA